MKEIVIDIAVFDKAILIPPELYKRSDVCGDTKIIFSNAITECARNLYNVTNSVPVGNNTEWRRSETLRGDERESSESDRQMRGEEAAVRGIQEDSKFGEISSEGTTVGEIQNGSRGRNTSRDSLRNITDSNETAEPEKVSVVSACYDRLKSTVISDERILNAINHSDRENLNIEIESVLNETVLKIFNEDVYKNIDFYADFVHAEKTDNRTEAENYIHSYIDEQLANKQNIYTLPENMTEIDVETAIGMIELKMNVHDISGTVISEINDVLETGQYITSNSDYEKYVAIDKLALAFDDISSAFENTLREVGQPYFLDLMEFHDMHDWDDFSIGRNVYQNTADALTMGNIAPLMTYLENTIEELNNREYYETEYNQAKSTVAMLEKFSEKYISNNISHEQDIEAKIEHTDNEAETVRTADDIAIGDKYQYNAVSYENSGLGQYREYEDGSSGQRDTNRFMGDWLKNIEQQE